MVKAIIGLGNPGREYERNRHNIGFQVIDLLAEKHGMRFDQRKFRALLAKGRILGHDVILAKPLTFMNSSGEAVGPLAHFYKIEPQDILVIADDLDIPQGRIRLRPMGSSGGHNGLKSIILHLGTEDFSRARIGIGRPPGSMDPADYVLQDFTQDEEAVMTKVRGRAVEAIETWLEEGIEAAMNKFNIRRQEGG